jgi:hypothetical protein
MYAFIALLTVLVLIYCMTEHTEGFTSTPVVQPTIPAPCPSGMSTFPDKGERDRSFDPNQVKPYSMPGELPVAGYEQIAAMSPLPYQDTTLIKANKQQLVSLLEMVKGFLAFEAQEISEKSDPSIQLPLQTARSDFHVLQREVEVQNRNPGIQSTITLMNLNEMSSNLAYLQQQVRLTGAAGSLQIPKYDLEGFQDIGKGQVATKQDLLDFVGKIQGEILRLSASGANDPIITTRVKALTDMKASIQQIIDQLTSGTLMEVEVPVMKNDITKAFPILGKPSEPLPQVIKTLGLPAGLANALPSSLQKDPQTMKQIGMLVNKYADQLVKGVSASVSIKYTSPNEAASNCSTTPLNPLNPLIPSTIDQTGFPSQTDLNRVSNGAVHHAGNKLGSQMLTTTTDLITDPIAAKPVDAGRGPSHFDWKQRAKEIENQVKQRGLRAADFGIQPTEKRSADFSWKGYAKMICTRLQATMDPALPETCGCPPMDWKGWR